MVRLGQDVVNYQDCLAPAVIHGTCRSRLEQLVDELVNLLQIQKIHA